LGDGNARFVLQDHPGEGQFSCDEAEDFDPATAVVPYMLRWNPPSWGGKANVKGASAAEVVTDLDLLLTEGRLHSRNRDIIEQAYANTVAKGGVSPDVAALRVAQALFAVTPEFSITNQLMNDKSIPEIRNTTEESLPSDPPPVAGYKAIIYVFMNGAMDSFSLLVPNSDCTPTNLLQQYQDTRDTVALDQDSLLSINVPEGTQPCNVFGIHPSLPTLKALYDEGDAAFIANVGPLVEPLTKDEYERDLKEQPPSLFAHNTQQRLTQTVHSQDSRASGVLGRIGDAINTQESELVGANVEIFDAYSISGTP
jgi:cullin-associated NEDD8-dissociated protein 1